MENIDKIKYIININLSKSGNIFDNFINDFESYQNKQAHTIEELKQKYNKKYIGDLFEAFCYLYIKNILKHDNVWFYKDFPLNSKEELNLTKNDYGIDLISEHNGEYYAIQCKYRKKQNKIQLVSWKTLSTFYAMVAKSGPWKKHIVMTNLNGCRHIGKKDTKDLSICIKTFQNMNSFDWIQLLGCNNNDHDNIPINKLRELRLKYYSEI